MHRVLAAAAAFALPCLAPVAASAQPDLAPYATATIGWSGAGKLDAAGADIVLGPFAVRENVKSGWIASALVGARIGAMPLSVEAEALYVRNKVASPDLNAAFGAPLHLKTRTKGALVNLKLAAPEPYVAGPFSLRPYAAAGLGYGASALNILGDDYKGDGSMWQAKAGVEAQITPRLSWDLGYRYLKLPSFHTNHLGLDVHLKTHVQAVSFGATYAFGAR